MAVISSFQPASGFRENAKTCVCPAKRKNYRYAFPAQQVMAFPSVPTKSAI
jgi:hypothetical protein